MQFTITLKLGNDAMRTGDDVAEALHAVADRLTHTGSAHDALQPGAGGPMFDANGNRVGSWDVTE